jgi:hypothetical protein
MVEMTQCAFFGNVLQLTTLGDDDPDDEGQAGAVSVAERREVFEQGDDEDVRFILGWYGKQKMKG